MKKFLAFIWRVLVIALGFATAGAHAQQYAVINQTSYSLSITNYSTGVTEFVVAPYGNKIWEGGGQVYAISAPVSIYGGSTATEAKQCNSFSTTISPSFNPRYIVSADQCQPKGPATPSYISASDGDYPGEIYVTWGSVPDATSYTLSYRPQGGSWSQTTVYSPSYSHYTQSTGYFEFSVTASNSNGTSASTSSDTGFAAPSTCAAGTVRWGGGNFCSATVSTTQPGGSVSVTNASTGAVGSGTAYCSGGNWSVSAPCTANMAAPATIAATQGTIAGGIQVTWGSVAGASSYQLSYRKQGAPSWSVVNGVSSGYQLSTMDEAVFEFMVTATNGAGFGTQSSVVTGYVRPQIMPLFVSQDIPANVKAGAAFTGTQVWNNIGATTWATGGAFYLGAASGSGDFGSAPGLFPSAIAQSQTGTSTLSLQAPATPGTYSFSRQFFKTAVPYGAPSTPAQVKVWGDPVCSGLIVSQPVVYDVNGVVSVTFAANDQTATSTATVWSDVNGTDDQKTYAPTAALGKFKFDVPLTAHTGFGVYHVKVEVSNPVASSTCEVQFDHREIAAPDVLSLTALVGESAGAEGRGFVVGQASGTPFIQATIGRTDGLALVVELLTPQGEVASSATFGAGIGSASLPSPRWDGGAWEVANFKLRVRYSGTDAASQSKVLEQPLPVVLSPAGNRVLLKFATGHPLVATTQMALQSQPYDAAKQGDWTSKVGVDGGADLDVLQAMPAGVRTHALAYDSLYGQSLLATARAVPPASVTLLSPLEVTSVLKVPVLPVRGLAATDGTLEDIVRVTWETPAQGGTGFTYELFRDDVQIDSGKSLLAFDDTPPTRGKEYRYRVVAIHTAVRDSADVSDTGFVPACRAPRLVGASVNADMSRINGLLERWTCLVGSTATGALDGGADVPVSIDGVADYRSFTFPLAPSVPDGPHVLKLRLVSDGVSLNADRTFDIPFTLNRASISVKSLSITYNGAPAAPGQEANSIGRFGIKMDGGTGIGFAEELK